MQLCALSHKGLACYANDVNVIASHVRTQCLRQVQGARDSPIFRCSIHMQC